MLVRHRGIRASQQPTDGTTDHICVSMRAGGGGEAASCRYKRLPGTSKGPKGGEPNKRHSGPWTDISGTTLYAKTEVPSGGELDVENVERGETYLGKGGLNIKEDTDIFLQGGH